MSQRPTNDELHGAAIMARVATAISSETTVTLHERAWLGLFVSCCILGELDKQLVPVPPRLGSMLDQISRMAPPSLAGMLPLGDMVRELRKGLNDDQEPWKEGGA